MDQTFAENTQRIIFKVCNKKYIFIKITSYNTPYKTISSLQRIILICVYLQNSKGHQGFKALLQVQQGYIIILSKMGLVSVGF